MNFSFISLKLFFASEQEIRYKLIFDFSTISHFSIAELPWNQATVDMSDYAKWKEGDIETSNHWHRLKDNLLLSLIRKMLVHSPSRRYTLMQIKNHLWYKKKFKDSGKVHFK